MRRGNKTGRSWAYAGAALGGSVSIAANTAHSYIPPPGARPDWQPPAGAVVGAVFWPVALALAAEILARTRWPVGRRWILLRFGGLLPVALVAAVVSYRHLSGLLTTYGEDTLTAVIGPLAVDGLMVMATAALLAHTHTDGAAPRSSTVEGSLPVSTPSDPVTAPTPVLPQEPVEVESRPTHPTSPVPPATRLRLPRVMQDAIQETADRAAAEGRDLTAADIRTAVRVPEEMAERILADMRPVNGHTITA